VTGIISRCSVCSEFFDSRRQLRGHIGRHHRITNSKMAAQEGEASVHCKETNVNIYNKIDES
jgi:hypothetical protein